MNEAYNLYLISYRLIEWWKRYETLGPEGGLKQQLVEAVKKFENKLKEEDLPPASKYIQEQSKYYLKSLDKKR